MRRSTIWILGAVALLSAGAADAQLRAPPVELPYAITADPVEKASGALKSGEVIAIHTVRAMDAIILQDEITGGITPLPAGLALAGIVTTVPDGPATGKAYCDIRTRGRMNAGGTDCVEDTDGDGKMDKLWLGRVNGIAFRFNVDSIAKTRKTIAPARYRAAAEAERPTSKVGLMTCRFGSVWRLKIALPVFSGQWATGSPDFCSMGDIVNPDQPLETAGALLTFSRNGGEIDYTLVRPIPPGKARYVTIYSRY